LPFNRRQAASATVGLAMTPARIQFTRLETGVSGKDSIWRTLTLASAVFTLGGSGSWPFLPLRSSALIQLPKLSIYWQPRISILTTSLQTKALVKRVPTG
jgi:hypothetical protein